MPLLSLPAPPAARVLAAIVLAGLSAGSGPAPARADQVTIRVKGGGLEVKGELRSFDGTRYVIEAPQLGQMSFDAARIDCIGDACNKRVSPPSVPYEPLDPAHAPTVTLRGSGAATETLLPVLIRGYAAAIGANVAPILGSPPGEARLRLTDARGAELATFALHADDAPLAALQQGTAAIALTEARLSDDEVKALAAANPDFKVASHEQLLAADGLALVVSPENPALSLSEDALVRILSAKAQSWIDVGVAGGRITFYTADRTGTALAQLAAGLSGGALLKPGAGTISVQQTRLATESEVSDAVARDANAIGIVSFAQQRNARRLNIEGSCGLIARPTPFAVKAGEWPLSRQLYAVSAGPLKVAAARDLLRYAGSREAQALLVEAGLIDGGVEGQAAEDQTGRMGAALNAPPAAFDMGQMQELLGDIKGARRLSLTFRFLPGTVDLDPASRRDVTRLAELLQGPDLAGQTVQLIGFTDAEGKFSAGVNATAKRAAQLRTAVLAAAGKLANPAQVQAKGHGALAPVACNDTPSHRQLNRRIEVWARKQP